jgi:phage terminase Nu1 subunit (DNA packaging protein)
MPEINLKELANLIGVSLPTAAALVDRHPDFPVIERGGLGKNWRFDAASVVEFLRAKRAEEAAERAARGDMLAQMVLPVDGPKDAAGKELSYKDQTDAAKLRALLRQEEIETRFLVRTDEMRTAFEKLHRALAANMTATLTAVQREHGIPEPVMQAIRAKFDNARTAFARDAADFLRRPDEDEGGEFKLVSD